MNTTTSVPLLPDRASACPDHDAPAARLGARRVVGSDVIYRMISSGEPGWIADSSGIRRPLHIDRWLGGSGSTDEDRRADDAILELCTGPTMDVGCGPGRFTAALADRGVPALGVDVSATAVEMTVQRGGTALHRDIFAPMPGGGQWSRLLLADGNIGIGGHPVRLLQRARELLHPGGVVVAEVDGHATGVTAEYRRWETHHSVGSWFPWAHVGSDAIAALAVSAGYLVASAVHVRDRCIVALEMA